MIIAYDDLAALRSHYANKKIVLSSGTFDLFHVNHLHYLQALRDYGDIVVVMVAGDARVAASKGVQRPIVPAQDRVEIIDGLSAVDYVFIEPGTNKRGQVDPVYASVFEQLKPDVFVSANEEWREFQEIMGSAELVILPRKTTGHHKSTSAIIEHIGTVHTTT